MHSHGSDLKELLQDFSKLPGRDRRQITRHLSGRDKVLMKEFLSTNAAQKTETETAKVITDVEDIEVKAHSKYDNIDAELDFSVYSPWLARRLTDVLCGDDEETDLVVTRASQEIILKYVENNQQFSVSKNTAEENSGQGIRSSLLKLGKRIRG